MFRSLAFRAALAVVLMVVYFALSIGAVAGLGWGGWFLLSQPHPDRFTGVIAYASLIAALVIVWSILPRIDRFKPPGPEIHADQQQLVAEIRRIADETGERMPDHVYVTWELNAFVAQRGGIMGIGSRRVMGIGLPLMRVLTVSELRAVLAHEMGHFIAGDTRLGPWIYKTRGAMGRTVINLVGTAQRIYRFTELGFVNVFFRIVIAPFGAFANMFMRITQAISRAQELNADRIAARCEGVAPLVDGLKKTHVTSVAYQVYMVEELLPLLELGKLPPAGAGFTTFMQSERAGTLAELVAKTPEKTDPLDSHPALEERIAALAGFEAGDRERETRLAIELLANRERIEHDVVAARCKRAVEAIAWADVPAFWTRHWREATRMLAPHVAGITIGAVPADVFQLSALRGRVAGEKVAKSFDPDMLAHWATVTLGPALVIALVDAGYTLVTDIGRPILLRKGELSCDPLDELAKLLTGALSRDEWCARWQQRGLADHPLAG